MKNKCKILGLLVATCFAATSKAMPVSVTSGNLNSVNVVNTVGVVNKDLSVDLLNTNLATTYIPNLGSQVVSSTQNLQTTLTQLMNTLDTRMVVQKVQESTLRKMEQVEPGASGCNVITGNIGTGSMGASIAKWREEMSQQELDMLLGNSVSSPSHAGRPTADIARVAVHCSLGATQAEVSQGVCSSANINNSAITGQSSSSVPSQYANLVGSDLNFNTIWSAPNGVLTSGGEAASNAFIMNAFQDHAFGPLPPSTGVGQQRAKLQAANRNTIVSQRSIALAAINEIIATGKGMDAATSSSVNAVENQVDSTSGTSSGSTTLLKWAEATAAQTIGMRKSESGSYYPNGVSMAAYEELRAKAWFWNLNWMGNINSEDEGQLLKEIAMIDAYGVYQNWELGRAMQMNNALLATMVDIMETERKVDVGESQ